jgi:hypothetical protein
MFWHREPKSIQPIFAVLTDELLIGQNTGFKVTDCSRALGAPRRTFYVKTVLLFWIGDYPGQGYASGLSHAGYRTCHWCYQKFSGTGGYWDGARRYLGCDHPWRTDASFGAPEVRDCPTHRTHAQTVREARANEAWTGPKNKQPKKRHGVNEFCFLSQLDFFDIIKDFLPDPMHILKNTWSNLILLMRGLRYPAMPRMLLYERSSGEFEQDEIDRRRRVNMEKTDVWEKQKEVIILF